MGRVSKDAVLSGTDLTTKEVEWKDGSTVLIESLPAAYSNEAESSALVLTQEGNSQATTIDTAKLEVLKFAHGVKEPEFTVEEAEEVAKKYGPAFKRVIKEIDAISGLEDADRKAAEARFPSGGDSRDK